MSKKRKSKLPGLILVKGVWHLDKQIKGQRICESTGETDYKKAETYALMRINEIREGGKRNIHFTFDQAATHYYETETKRSMERDSRCLDIWVPLIGNLSLAQIHQETLRPYINERLKVVRSSTVIRELAVIRRILSLAARVWRDEHNRPWLETLPLISDKALQKMHDKRKAYPISWSEQNALFSRLPAYIQDAALFKVNTGTRQQEVCGLRWSYEVPNQNVFIIPGELVKNGQDRVVILNSVARAVIESRRGIHPEYVFTYNNKRISRINNRAWRKAWVESGLPVGNVYYKGVHYLKHTFGKRLRQAEVPHETRQLLLGHTNGDITTHYSEAELEELINASEKVLKSRKSPEVK